MEEPQEDEGLRMLYPNPASTSIHFQLVERIELFALDGSMPYLFNVSGKQELDISSVYPGLYIARLFSNDKSIIVKLLVNR